MTRLFWGRIYLHVPITLPPPDPSSAAAWCLCFARSALVTRTAATPQRATLVSLQGPPPYVSFNKQQRLACNRRFPPGWIARKRTFIIGSIPYRSEESRGGKESRSRWV